MKPTICLKVFSRTSFALAGIALLAGCGSQPANDVFNPDVSVAAVCDVDESHLDNGAADVINTGRPAPKKVKDFRRLLEQKDIDAVIIGTPDHWHAIPFIAACEAGKDIYCEKPTAVTVRESQAMLAAVRRYGRVYQAGTQQRSLPLFLKALALVRAGRLGRLRRATCLIGGAPRGGYSSAMMAGFAGELLTNIVPFIETNFRAKTGARDRALAGLSAGSYPLVVTIDGQASNAGDVSVR